MCIMGADEKQCNRNTKKKLLGGRVLRAIVNLLPHVEIVKSATVEIEGNATNMVEHDVGAKHV